MWIYCLQIAVEGNIASGKTTLLNVFAKQYSAEVNKQKCWLIVNLKLGHMLSLCCVAMVT